MSKTKPVSITIQIMGDEDSGREEFLSNLLSNFSLKGKLLKTTKINNVEYSVIESTFDNKRINVNITLNSKRSFNVLKDADCIIIMFNMTKRSSFESLLTNYLVWLRENGPEIKCLYVIGNCPDKTEDKRLVTDDEEVKELLQVSKLEKKIIRGCYLNISDLNDEEKIEKITALFLEVYLFLLGAEEREKIKAYYSGHSVGSKGKNGKEECRLF